MAAYPPTHIPIPKNHADFESKSVILLRLLLEDPGVKKLGRSGQKQYGIDLIGYRKASLNRPVGIQCKKKKPGEALTASKESRRFEVDTTPPRIENLAASVEGEKIHVSFRAGDGFSSIKRAEYSVDAGDWKYVEPVGQLSDAKSENYDFTVSPEPAKNSGASSEHVVVVRVFDRYDNMGAAKTLIRGK